MSEERYDVTIALDDERIAWQPLHEALEALDEAGFVPHRFHAVPERELARLDADLGGTFAAEMLEGGAWILEAKQDTGTPARVIGCAAYGAALGDEQVGRAGPFSLDGPLAPFRSTIFLGVLFSLRERGYRQAIIARVTSGALQRLRETFGASIIRVDTIAAMPKPRVVVCASGNGSNFQALIDAVAAGVLQLDITRLIVNRSQAFVRERAAAANIETRLLVWKRAEVTRDLFDARVLAEVREASPDLVLLLGWMHLLPPAFVAAFAHVLNVHPAYLPLDPRSDLVALPDGSTQPAFRGAHALDDALAAGAQWTGASVHQVTDETDRGKIYARAPLRIDPHVGRDALNTQLHALEHRVLIDAISAWTTRRPKPLEGC